MQEASDGQTDVDRNGGELLSWQQIDQEAGSDTLKGYQLLDNSPLDGHPRTAPTTVLASDKSTTTDKPVLFYRDTNAWCPFCERVSQHHVTGNEQSFSTVLQCSLVLLIHMQNVTCVCMHAGVVCTRGEKHRV